MAERGTRRADGDGDAQGGGGLHLLLRELTGRLSAAYLANDDRWC